MIGAIIIWSGAIVDIPAGWQLCDGTNGTPDLRARFVFGAGNPEAPDDTGGTKLHTHTFTGDSHTHLAAGTAILEFGTDVAERKGNGTAVGTTDQTDHRPPWYALAYIQRMS